MLHVGRRGMEKVIEALEEEEEEGVVGEGEEEGEGEEKAGVVAGLRLPRSL